MTLQDIHKEYDKMQALYGERSLKAVYGGGCDYKPEVMFVFMNPTATNLASFSSWNGLNAPFIGTKSVWKVFNKLNLISDELLVNILNKKPNKWSESFAQKVYNEVNKSNIYITNFAKCTQKDARSLKDNVLSKYLELLEKEITIINPKIIVCFGNQVSSLFLNKKIEVGKNRKLKHIKQINGRSYETYACYYPIGLGFRNINKVIEDLNIVLKSL